MEPIIRPRGENPVGRSCSELLPSRRLLPGTGTLPLHAGVEHPQDEVEDAMIAQFTFRPAAGHRKMREDKCDELRLGELDGNRRRSWAFCHIAHRKWVDVKPERSSPESLTIAYNTKGYGTRKTRNHLEGI